MEPIFAVLYFLSHTGLLWKSEGTESLKYKDHQLLTYRADLASQLQGKLLFGSYFTRSVSLPTENLKLPSKLKTSVRNPTE